MREFRIDDDATYTENRDLIVGQEFHADFSLHTPLATLQKHGEIFKGKPSDAPRNGPYVHGLWMHKTKSFRELGIDMGDFTISDCASEIGPVKPDEFIAFATSFRLIVESDLSVTQQIKAIRAIKAESPFHAKLYRQAQRNLEDFPASFFYNQFRRIKGIGPAAAKKLFSAGFHTMEQLLLATPEQFSMKKIPAGLVAKIAGAASSLSGGR
jgi:hypothetical protein